MLSAQAPLANVKSRKDRPGIPDHLLNILPTRKASPSSDLKLQLIHKSIEILVVICDINSL